MQSIYYHRKDLFFKDICDKWTRDKKTGEKIESPAFHALLWEGCSSGEDVLAIIARDHAKTTAVSKMLTLWLTLFEEEKSILFLMSKGLGEEVLGAIREELEQNKSIKAIWGVLVPVDDKTDRGTKKWRQRELQLLNGVELKTITRGEPIRGRRPTKVIVDDPQEDKDVKNPVIAAEFYSWVFTTVYPTISPGGSMVVLGTVISDNCFVSMLKAQALIKQFRLIEYPAILDFDPEKDIEFYYEGERLRVRFLRGRPLWPAKWSIKKLEERCEKMMEDGKDIRKFKQEYLNVPFDIASAPVFSGQYNFVVIPPIEIIEGGTQYFREIDPALHYSVGMDFAEGKKQGDYSTIIIRDMAGRLYRQYRGHIAQHLLPDILENLLLGIKHFIIVPESNFAQVFLHESRDRYYFPQIYRRIIMDKVTQQETEELGWRTTAKSKIMMINGLQKFYADGETEVSSELKLEIAKYYYDEKGGMNAKAPYHDDLVMGDACCRQGMLVGVPDSMPEWA